MTSLDLAHLSGWESVSSKFEIIDYPKVKFVRIIFNYYMFIDFSYRYNK